MLCLKTFIDESYDGLRVDQSQQMAPRLAALQPASRPALVERRGVDSSVQLIIMLSLPCYFSLLSLSPALSLSVCVPLSLSLSLSLSPSTLSSASTLLLLFSLHYFGALCRCLCSGWRRFRTGGGGTGGLCVQCTVNATVLCTLKPHCALYSD